MREKQKNTWWISWNFHIHINSAVFWGSMESKRTKGSAGGAKRLLGRPVGCASAPTTPEGAPKSWSSWARCEKKKEGTQQGLMIEMSHVPDLCWVDIIWMSQNSFDIYIYIHIFSRDWKFCDIAISSCQWSKVIPRWYGRVFPKAKISSRQWINFRVILQETLVVFMYI